MSLQRNIATGYDFFNGLLDLDPFETVWLGYRLPYTTPDEQEDLQYVFRDQTDGERFNFMKCIWTKPDP